MLNRPKPDDLGKTKPKRAVFYERVCDAYRSDYQPLHLDLAGIFGHGVAYRIQDNKSLATGSPDDH